MKEGSTVSPQPATSRAAKCCFGYGISAIALLTVIGTAQASEPVWTATPLTIPGNLSSSVSSVADDQIGGFVTRNGIVRAGFWNGAAHTWVDLDQPAIWSKSSVSAVSDGMQFGSVFIGGAEYAARWSGTANSFAWMEAPGAGWSTMTGAADGQQVGYAGFQGTTRAGVWSGPDHTWTHLHPANATESKAGAVGNGQQGGYAKIDGANRAALWWGTAASFVNLHPAGANNSQVLGIGDGVQAGSVFGRGQGGVGAIQWRASLWRGSAESWVDLNPAGSFRSSCFSADGNYQVGEALIGDIFSASLWTGTAESWVDLGKFLPEGEYTSSGAKDVWVGDDAVYVAGTAYNIARSRSEPILWTLPIPAPSSAIAVLGLGGLAAVRRKR